METLPLVLGVSCALFGKWRMEWADLTLYLFYESYVELVSLMCKKLLCAILLLFCPSSLCKNLFNLSF